MQVYSLRAMQRAPRARTRRRAGTYLLASVLLCVIATPSVAQDKGPLIDSATHSYTPYGAAILVVATAQVAEMKCNLNGAISSAVALAAKTGVSVDVNDKEDFASIAFIASSLLGQVKASGAQAWCDKAVPELRKLFAAL